MFVERPDIKEKLDGMSVTIKSIIANTFIFDKSGVFRGEIAEPFVVQKNDFVPPDALFLGDYRDRGYGLKYFVDVNSGISNLDKVLEQLPINAETFTALLDLVAKRRFLQQNL